MFVIVSWISFLMPLDRGAFNNYMDPIFDHLPTMSEKLWTFYMPYKYPLSTLTFYDLGCNKFWGDTSNVVGISNLPTQAEIG